MANTIQSLIGPSVTGTINNTGGPAATVVPNTSAANTQTTLRRCYTVNLDAGTTLLTFQTGLPVQDSPGSFVLTVTPVSGDGIQVYAKQVSASYSAATGVVGLHAAVGPKDAPLLLAIDLAHTLTR